MTALNLESWFKSEEEQMAVKNYIDREIFCLGNEFQQLYAQANECWYDDVTNLMEGMEHTIEDYKEFLRENHITEDTTVGELREMLAEYDGEDSDNYGPYDNYFNEFVEKLKDEAREQEVMQWFIVSGWLADKLEKIGQPVLRTDNHTLWGRCCYGQSIELDGTLQKVYRYVEKQLNS